MSASRRSLARLPLDIFNNLKTHTDEPTEPELLRGNLCNKLKQGRPSSGIAGVTTVGELLRMSLSSLLRAVDPLLTYVECQEFIRRICVACAPTRVTALSLYSYDSSSMRYLSTGMPHLDSCLRGGIRVGMISEVVGRAGTCKTQLALQLCLTATKHDLGCVFIDTEKKLSLRRLKEMAQERAMTSLVASNSTQMNEDDQGGAFSYTAAAAMSATGPEESAPIGSLQQQPDQRPFKSARQVLTNTTVHSPGSTIELLDVINGLEEEILIRNENASSANDGTFPVGLVILDSIAAPARRDFGKESAPQRVSALLQIAQTLKRLADQLQIAVVVINQVGQQDSGGGDFVSVQAALGTAWHHCVSTRLLMENEQDDGSAGPWEGGVASKQTRRATVVKSTDAGEASMMFTVQSLGLTEAESS